MIKKLILAAMVLSLTSLGAIAATDKSNISKKKQTTLGLYYTAQEAYDHMVKNGDNTLFIDVRTRPETMFIGMPALADANVPYMELNEWYAWNEKKNEFKMEVNSEFAPELEKRLQEKHLTKNDTVIVMCRSGSRSAKAADLLAKLGYTQVYTVIDGFEGDKAKSGPQKGQRVVNGWKNIGLPWSYSLAKAKMFKVAAE